jgi:FKBP-type peptidyl-prolyl cis-trans isomerase 2
MATEKKFVKIAYTAKLKKEGTVFETTDEEIAKKSGTYNKKIIYKPIPVIVGEGHVVRGVDELLGNMNVGDEKEINVTPDKGFGRRDPNLIRLVPRKIFTQQKINPVPGMAVTLDGKPAKVQTVSGGRVRVDFNSELAGSSLIYNVRVEEEAKDEKEKVRYLIERSFNSPDNFKITLSKSRDLNITLSREAFSDKNILIRKASLSAEIFKYLDVDKITYEEVWENPNKSDTGVEKQK